MEWLYSAFLSLVLTCIVGYLAYRRLKSVIADTIDDFGSQFVEKLQELFSPTMKKGFSLAGSLGGKRKAVNELKGEMAKGFLSKNLGLVKVLAEQFLGLNVEDLIDQYGADTILQAVQELGPLLKGGGGGNLLGGFMKNNPGNQQVPTM